MAAVKPITQLALRLTFAFSWAFDCVAFVIQMHFYVSFKRLSTVNTSKNISTVQKTFQVSKFFHNCDFY